MKIECVILIRWPQLAHQWHGEILVYGNRKYYTVVTDKVLQCHRPVFVSLAVNQ